MNAHSTHSHAGRRLRAAIGFGISCIALAGTSFALPQDVRRDLFDDPRMLGGAELRDRVFAGAAELDVIVSLQRSPSMESFSGWQEAASAAKHRAEVARRIDAVLADLPRGEFSLRHRLENTPCFSGRITLAGLELLLLHPFVELVEPNRTVIAHTDQGITLMNGDVIRSQFTGSRLSIAIVDTGIDYTHPALGNAAFPNAKVIGGRDFGDNDSDPMDQHGHGTSVAGIAAGNVVLSGNYVGGVAPGALLYALKIVPGDQGSASDADIQAAWDWCVTHRTDDAQHPILVINTSFGGGFNASPCSTGAYQTTAAAAVAAGIALFVSSGNDGYCNGIGTPACAPSVISVGAVYDANIGTPGWCDIAATSCVAVAGGGCGSGSTGFVCQEAATSADQVTCYSNSASFLHLLAPSHNASTPALGGGYSASFGGTSAASPYAAGAAALILDAALAANTTIPPAILRTTMISTGNSITDPKSSVTTPRVNIGAAVGVWVDFAYVGTEQGTFSQPYNTVLEGVNAVNAGGTVVIKPGTTSQTITITKALLMRSHGGTVVIGQ